jgi:hypothetical protein
LHLSPLKDVAIDPALVSVRAALLIGGFEFLAVADYELALCIEQGPAAIGYTELR